MYYYKLQNKLMDDAFRPKSKKSIIQALLVGVQKKKLRELPFMVNDVNSSLMKYRQFITSKRLLRPSPHTVRFVFDRPHGHRTGIAAQLPLSPTPLPAVGCDSQLLMIHICMHWQNIRSYELLWSILYSGSQQEVGLIYVHGGRNIALAVNRKLEREKGNFTAIRFPCSPSVPRIRIGSWLCYMKPGMCGGDHSVCVWARTEQG